MKKKIIITVCMAMAALTGLAQSPLSFHAKAGIGTSHFHGKHSGSDTQMAYKAGIGAEYVLNKTWVLQSALEFVSIGGKDEIGHVGNARMHELYLQIPLMTAARLHLGKDYHASLSVGPYAAIGVAGKTSGETYNHSSSVQEGYRFKTGTFGSMADGKMGNHHFDAGIAVGLTFEYKRFIIGAETQVGLVKVNEQINQMISHSEEGGGYFPKNFAAFFTLGYRFR
ncbi:PorT family protein [Bacteroides muris (ex Fokt et al. 2023)]|uniref:PorT family protein n=1 Tax=Bacteroides muris (ex Fokt et al. 2023) TaxID=2937417 RepID=A0A9X2ST50_9BACE|nr:PorT family protein [Bacteroides muris (ex Fokt et al. 2023)]MCR6505501.1 PorT family protein [Bacteroides muris (ex Fokt et al. 2023)]